MRLHGVHIPPPLEQAARGYRIAGWIRLLMIVLLAVALAAIARFICSTTPTHPWLAEAIPFIVLFVALVAGVRFANRRARREATKLVHEHGTCVCGGEPLPPARDSVGNERFTCASCGDTWVLDDHGFEVPTDTPREWPRVIAGVHIPPGLRMQAVSLARQENTESVFRTMGAMLVVCVPVMALGSWLGLASNTIAFESLRGVCIAVAMGWSTWRTTRLMRPKVQAFLNAQGYCGCGYPSVDDPKGADASDRLCPECGATWTIAKLPG